MMFVTVGSGLSAQSIPDLIPYTDGVLWGYSNAQGKVMIAPQWKQATPFNGNKARVQLNPYNREYQLIDKKGQYIVPPSRHWNGEWMGFARTAFNAKNDSGKAGMIDTNNQLLIPFLYPHEYSTFQYSPYWKRYYLITTINNKHGIIDTLNHAMIPFEYERLDYLLNVQRFGGLTGLIGQGSNPELEPYSSAMMKLIIARKEGKYGLIDIDNKVIIPFGLYDNLRFTSPSWIVCSKQDQYELRDTAGRIILPASNKYPVAAGTHYFIVSAKKGIQTSYGLIDEHRDTMLALRYSEITTQKGEIKLSLSDSAPPPELVKAVRSLPIGHYERRLNSNTLLPLENWHYEPLIIASSDGYYCGNAAKGAYEYRQPVTVWIRDSAVTYFNKDSFQWQVISRIGPNQIVLNGSLVKNYYQDKYTSIVNEQLEYVYPPTIMREKILHLNLKDSLLVLQGAYDGKATFTVTDFNRQIQIPYQYETIVAGFRWKGKIYAFSGQDKAYSHLIDSKPAYQTIRAGKIIDSAGRSLEALKPYQIVYIAHADGTYSNQFEGYFYVRDSTGRPGIVSIEGDVQYRKLSFCDQGGNSLQNAESNNSESDPLLVPIGNGWFIRNHLWIDSTGKELAPGLLVSSIEPAKYSSIHTAKRFFNSPTPIQPIPGLYIMNYEENGIKRQCYVTSKGLMLIKK